jgi:hypothetical protein
MSSKVKSDFLIAQPGFVSGAARLWDWYGQYDSYNQSRDGREADIKALFSDWYIVGQDINDAMMEFEASQPVK